MKAWLLLVAAFLLWPGCFSQNECEEPDEIDFGEIVSAEKAKYLENDRVQYRCNPSYVLEGPEWIQCKGQEWTPHPPKCLAPCSITRQQLTTKNLFLFGNQRKARLIQSDHSLQFQCNEGYVLVVPSVRKCVDGYMDFPLCISERGKNCRDPPRIENGDIIPLSEQQYRSGSSVEFRCQTYYAMGGQNRSYCDDGTWTKVPVCLQITCNSPSILHGSFRPQRTIYHDGDLIQIQCDSGFTFEPDNRDKVVECTKNGWSSSPKCVDIEGGCGRPPTVDNGDIVETLKENYVQSESVTYQCQNLYTMEGSARVTCQNGQWSQTPVCRGKGCDYVRIKNGRIENYYEKYGQFPKREGETIRFYCYSGFLPKGKQTWQTATCINSRFEPELKCFKICDPPLYFYHGHIIYNYRNTYIEGDSISFVCNKGYSPANQQSTITCTKKGWSPAPRCILPDIEGGCGSPPAVDNGDIVETLKENYVQSESVTYQCQNLYIMEGSARVTCQNGQWSQTPVCRDIGGKCGRPPRVENGDIVDSFKPIYLHSESVIYQCQHFYTMQGSPRVTCQNSRWSQTPTCRVPCTASEEDMREHNIRLKWNRGDKIYSEDGNIVEFVCLRGYKPHPNTRPLRVNCVDGKFDYPDCIPI